MPDIERRISTILSARFIGKVGKYIVKLAFPDEKAKEYWLSEKQLDSLDRALSQTPHGYSTDKVQIMGVFNEKGYYQCCRVVRAPWQPPRQYDLSDLEDDDDDA